MKKKGSIFGLILGLLLVSAIPAQAAADFEGNCQTVGSTVSCQFDAQRGSGSSCPGSSILTYSWSFGDGSASLGGNPINHTYTAPLSSYYRVDLLVYCANGSQSSTSRYVCIFFSFSGCILNNSGWN